MTRRKDPSQPPPLSHEKQREIVSNLSKKGLSVETICEYSGLTRASVEHHLWFLDHLRLQAAKADRES